MRPLARHDDPPRCSTHRWILDEVWAWWSPWTMRQASTAACSSTHRKAHCPECMAWGKPSHTTGFLPVCTPTGAVTTSPRPWWAAKLTNKTTPKWAEPCISISWCIAHITAYSPQTRGRGERAFQTHQGRLPQELAKAGITDMDSANTYLEQCYRAAHNQAFAVASTLPDTTYVPFIRCSLPDVMCDHHER